MYTKKPFYICSDIVAEYAVFSPINNQNLIEKIYDLFPENKYCIANIYVYYSSSSQPPCGLLEIKKKHPVNIINSRGNIPVQVQVCAIWKAHLKNQEYIYSNDNVCGLFLESKENRMLFLDGIETPSEDFKDSLCHIYETVFSIIKEHCFNPQDIIKFWNFIPSIITKYKDFNAIRNRYFEKNNILGSYPAGTGIDCHLPSLSPSLASCILLQPKQSNTFVQPKKTPKQCEAEYYGPKFSRSIHIKHANGNVLFISGTAAVSQDGETLFSHDITSNIIFTMNTVYGLLHEVNLSFDDIQYSFVYLKKIEFKSVFEQIYRKNNWSFPYIYTVCDICRDDWLFEFEGVAARNKNNLL